MNDFPNIFRVRQRIDGPKIGDVAEAVQRELAGLGLENEIGSGRTVAVTAGSRGISNIDSILHAAVEFFQSLGAEVFIVPAMGSHGGSTPEGQLAILRSLGVTETTVGCPIRADMDTVQLATAPEGFPVHFARTAYEADHVVVIGRVKAHTMFGGQFQSGIVKMLLTGLGKQAGAQIYHAASVDFGFDPVAQSALSIILDRANVCAALAIVENGYGETAQVAGMRPDEIVSEEMELLAQAAAWMPKLPFPEADILLVDEIGKHISGTGMDTNVIGRKFNDHAAVEGETPRIRRIVVRSVAGGNAIGIGMAEFCTARAIEQTDWNATKINSITSNHVTAGMVPISFSSDREIITAALTTIGLTEPHDVRLMWIKNTGQVETVGCSVAYLEEARASDKLEILDEPHELPFDEAGNLREY